MIPSCCGGPAPKEKKFGVKVCRERKCVELQRDPKWPDDSAERCTVFNTMPGTLPCCIKDPEIQPEVVLRQGAWHLLQDWEKGESSIKIPNPGPKNCPDKCPYKFSEVGETFRNVGGEYKKVTGKISRCAFTGGVLGTGDAGRCLCHVLGNSEQEKQIETIRQTIFHRNGVPFDRAACNVVGCPDGIVRCKAGDIICPVIKLPFIEIKECPLWRIPAKTLSAIADPAIPEKPDPEVEKKQAPPKKKEKARTIEDRIDSLEQDLEIYLWADITQCCVLIQEIKCLLRSIKKKEKPPTKIHKAAPRIEPNQSDLFSFDVQPEEPAVDKIPHIGWCSQRACPELDWEGGICITTGKKIKEQTYCPTQHLADKQTLKVRKCCPTCAHHKTKKSFEETCPRKDDLMFNGGHLSATALMLETSLKDCEHWIPKPAPEKKPAKKSATKTPKPLESPDTLRQFLNDHQNLIVGEKDLPICPPLACRQLYDSMNKDGLRPLKLFISTKGAGGVWNWWTLSPSGKLRKVKGPAGGHHQGTAYPDCAFHFEWHYDDKKKEQ